MDKHIKGREAIRKDISQPGDRSALFWWLLENHDWMAEAAAHRRMRWDGCANILLVLD
jgi:hypothetical protein